METNEEMTEPLLDRIRRVAADVLETSADKITLDSSPETIDTWDSVHHLNLVLALEQEFDLQFEPEEIDQMKDVRHVLEILGSKVQQV
jgi:acyl carrier protein